MKVNIVMPKMGESVNEGTLIKWHKKKGEKVKKDEILFEISTDKVDTEIPSPEEGTLVDIKVYEQETVEVDTVVAVIETKNGREPQVEAEPEPEIATTTQVGGELIDVIMPKMGESVMEGTIIKWHKKAGETVQKDEILFEISTDKVDTEVPAPVEGTIDTILVKEQETVEVGMAVARISSKGGIVNNTEKDKKSEQEKVEKAEVKSEADSQKKHKPGINKFFSPRVLKLAREHNISFDELENIEGTGENGRVTKKDVLDFNENKKSGKNISEKAIDESKSIYIGENQPEPVEKPEKGIEIIPLDNIRKRIMYHMVNSRDTSVHVTGMTEIDMSGIYNYIQQKKQQFQVKEGIKLTYMPFIAHAVIKALKEFPLMNSSIDDDGIKLKHFINLGIAVAVEPNGLIVPNIKNADEKSVRGLAKDIYDLSVKSRNKKLSPDDIVDGTFTITNYGIFGSLFGTPIINQPEVGILGVGAVTKKPVVVEAEGIDTIAIKPMMYLSLSHDHRLIDGMIGGRFLEAVKEKLEKFDVKVV